MKSTIYPTTICALFLLTGCDRNAEQLAPPPIEGPQFCDVEEPRRFTQAELDWRSANAPWNLRRDFQTNATWDRECAPEAPAAAEEPL